LRGAGKNVLFAEELHIIIVTRQLVVMTEHLAVITSIVVKNMNALFADIKEGMVEGIVGRKKDMLPNEMKMERINK